MSGRVGIFRSRRGFRALWCFWLSREVLAQDVVVCHFGRFWWRSQNVGWWVSVGFAPPSRPDSSRFDSTGSPRPLWFVVLSVYVIAVWGVVGFRGMRSEEHTSELQSQ